MVSRKSNSLGTVLITGGARRIGKAIALALAAEGYNIALHYHSSKKEAQQTIREIREQGVVCEGFVCDLTSNELTSRLIQQVHRIFPDLCLLVNNASVFIPSELPTATYKVFERDMAVHVRAPFILTQEFARRCRAGQIINILDSHISGHETKHFTYLLAKKTLADFTRMAAVALAPAIRVNGIAPGPILPPTGADKQELKKKLGGSSLLQRQGSTENIVQTVQFLMKNTYLTGQIIYNDGGESLV